MGLMDVLLVAVWPALALGVVFFGFVWRRKGK